MGRAVREIGRADLALVIGAQASLLVKRGALRPPGFENELFAAAAGGSLAAYAHGYLLNPVAGLEIRVDIRCELLPSPGDCSIGA